MAAKQLSQFVLVFSLGRHSAENLIPLPFSLNAVAGLLGNLKSL